MKEARPNCHYKDLRVESGSNSNLETSNLSQSQPNLSLDVEKRGPLSFTDEILAKKLTPAGSRGNVNQRAPIAAAPETFESQLKERIRKRALMMGTNIL